MPWNSNSDDHATRTETAPAGATDRHDAVAVEREHHGGLKWGSAFFGWLCAVGMAVLLTALLSAVGAAVGLAEFDQAETAEEQLRSNVETIGVAGGIALLVILFLAYYAGGYVAGRMARFDGGKQGFGVWLWAIVVAVVVAVAAAVAGDEYNVLSRLDSFPRIPVGEGELATGGIVTAVLALVVSLVGAVLGGLAGMRFHRRVDRTGFGG